eukprot:gene4480-7861_t
MEHNEERMSLDEMRKNRPLYSKVYERSCCSFVIVFLVVMTQIWVFISGAYLGANSYHFLIFFPIIFIAGFFVSMSIYSYLKCVFTNGGMVPINWDLTGEEMEKIENRQSVFRDDCNPKERKQDGRIRYCKRCRHLKPDRCHHCSSCDQCVLKMDHHCPWVNNCVGFHNYKYFILFLIYTCLGCLYGVPMMIYPIYHSFSKMFYATGNSSQELPSLADINGLWVGLVMLLFGCTLFFFTIYHIKLILANTTTNETFQDVRRVDCSSRIHPYDVGYTQNWRLVMGNDWRYWFIPTSESVEGDGLEFPTCIQNDIFNSNHLEEENINEVQNSTVNSMTKEFLKDVWKQLDFLDLSKELSLFTDKDTYSFKGESGLVTDTKNYSLKGEAGLITDKESYSLKGEAGLITDKESYGLKGEASVITAQTGFKGEAKAFTESELSLKKEVSVVKGGVGLENEMKIFEKESK